MENQWCACHRRSAHSIQYFNAGESQRANKFKRKQDANGKSIILSTCLSCHRFFVRFYSSLFHPPPEFFFFRYYFRLYIRNSTSKHRIFACISYHTQYECTCSPSSHTWTRPHTHSTHMRASKFVLWCRWGWSYIVLYAILCTCWIFASYDCAYVDNVDDDGKIIHEQKRKNATERKKRKNEKRNSKWKMVCFCVAVPC